MKNKYFLLILIFFIFIFDKSFSNEKKIDELKKISKNLRCLVCQGQSINDSNSDFAINVKKLILTKLENGAKEEEIYSFLKSKYGEWIVYKPEFKPHNFFLWLMPYAVFIIGGFYIFFKVVKKNRKTTNE